MGGGFANVGLLQQGKCDLALIHDAEAVLARDGKDPFKAPVDSIRTVAVMYMGTDADDHEQGICREAWHLEAV